MSAEAANLIEHIRKLFELAGNPEPSSWYFDPGIKGAAHTELSELGLVLQVLGTRRGFAWRLTEEGFRRVLGEAGR